MFLNRSGCNCPLTIPHSAVDTKTSRSRRGCVLPYLVRAPLLCGVLLAAAFSLPPTLLAQEKKSNVTEDARIFSGHEGDITAVGFAAGNRIVSWSKDRTLRLWDIATGKELRRQETEDLTGLEDQGMMRISPDGRLALLGEAKGDILLWDLENWKELRRFSSEKVRINCLCFSSSGRHVLCSRSTLRVWEVETGKELQRISTPPAYALTMSRDGTRLASSGQIPYIEVWDMKTGKALRGIPMKQANLRYLAFSANGAQLIAGNFFEGMRHTYDLRMGKETARCGPRKDSLLGPCSIMAPDARHILYGLGKGFGSVLRVWDLEGGKEAHQFKGHKNNVTSVACSSDGRQIVSGSADTTIRLWEVPRSITLASPGKPPGSSTKQP